MRDIKFRAWDKFRKSMTDRRECGPVVVWEDGLSPAFELRADQFIIMQFTGLKDKDGVDIFEGDIVRFSEHYCGDSTIPESVEVIKYELQGFNDSLQVGFMDCPEWCEVVGNIYENPELIGGL